MAIVIVDDSATNLAVLKSLSARIYQGEAKAFIDSELAAAYLADHEADLIVVDYSMPGLNGVDFIRKVRSGPLHRATPIVMVTHSSDQSVRLQAMQAGATDFLNKPVEAIEFKTRVANLLIEGARRGSPEAAG
jgi:putative two-component system response regulator